MERDPEWELLLQLASIPLRQLGPDLRPVDSGAGCLVHFQERRWLITAAHVTSRDWAIEIGYVGNGQTKLFRTEPLRYLNVGNLSTDEIYDSDLGFVQVPVDLQPFHQVFSEDGRVEDQFPKAILRADFDVEPQVGRRYGFSGQTRLASYEEWLMPELTVETDLWFRGRSDGFGLFELGYPHPGDSHFRGCSGAPVMDEEGQLVGVLAGREDGSDLIRAILLSDYRGAFDAEIVHGSGA